MVCPPLTSLLSLLTLPVTSLSHAEILCPGNPTEPPPPGAGYDQINIPACTARKILVSNTPTAVDDSTADLTIFLILGALRNLPVSMTSLREGQWKGNPSPALGHDPQGKVLGILGMGGIGRAVARRVGVFGMTVKYYNRTRLAEDVERECGAEYVSFERLLAESDVLSLNLPLNVSFPRPFVTLPPCPPLPLILLL